MEFNDGNLLNTLNNADEKSMMKANFGIVKMDKVGKILLYNDYEAKLAGLEISDTLGKIFFTDIAPCTNNFMFAQKYIDNESLDETFDYMFTYRLKPTNVKIRLLRSPNDAHGYALVLLK